MAGQVNYAVTVFAVAIVFVVGPEFLSWVRKQRR
jgi:hypothetical protein